MKARIATIDIETMADAVFSWGIYGQNWNAIEVIVPWSVLCVGVKPLGKKPYIIATDDYEGYKPLIERRKDGIFLRRPDDYDVILETWKVLNEYDIIIGWNSKRFDVKKLQAKMLSHGLGPPSPFKQIDLLQEKKKVANSTSNRLDSTGEEWGTGRKLENPGWPLWRGVAEGDPKAWSLMKRYCLQDIRLTEKNYEVLRPWIVNHPNLNVFEEKNDCPKCGARHTLIKRGFAPSGGRKRQIYQCLQEKGGCGGYSTGELLPQDTKVFIK